MSTKYLVALLLLTAQPTSALAGFDDFRAETATVTKLIKCPSPKITSGDGLPNLYGCTLPGAEVVKVYVNASADNVGVENVKFMWNDWTKDVGYGVHTDKEIANAWLAAIATRYAPENVQEALSAFAGNTGVKISSSEFNVEYTFSPGPAINERLMTITQK